MNLTEITKWTSPNHDRIIMIFQTVIIIDMIGITERYVFDKKWNRLNFSYSDNQTWYYNNRTYHQFKSTDKIKDMRAIWLPYVSADILLDIFIVPRNRVIKGYWYHDMTVREALPTVQGDLPTVQGDLPTVQGDLSTVQKIRPNQIPREIQGVYERPGMIHFWIGDCWFVYQ